jgi:hypothetical protein
MTVSLQDTRSLPMHFPSSRETSALPKSRPASSQQALSPTRCGIDSKDSETPSKGECIHLHIPSSPTLSLNCGNVDASRQHSPIDVLNKNLASGGPDSLCTPTARNTRPMWAIPHLPPAKVPQALSRSAEMTSLYVVKFKFNETSAEHSPKSIMVPAPFMRLRLSQLPNCRLISLPIPPIHRLCRSHTSKARSSTISSPPHFQCNAELSARHLTNSSPLTKPLEVSSLPPSPNLTPDTIQHPKKAPPRPIYELRRLP